MGLFDRFLTHWRVDRGVMRALRKDWQGDTEGALRDLHALIAAKGSTPDRLNALAVLEIKIAQPTEALAHIEQALTTAPANPEFVVTHARALRRLGRYDEALSRIQAQYQIDEKNIFVGTEMSKVLIDMGRTEEAGILLDNIESWFDSIMQTPRARQTGMTQAYMEARDKLRHARDRNAKAGR